MWEWGRGTPGFRTWEHRCSTWNRNCNRGFITRCLISKDGSWGRHGTIWEEVRSSSRRFIVVPSLKSFQFHRQKSLFVITGCQNILLEFKGGYSLFHQSPIEIFLLNSQKGGYMRKGNYPPFVKDVVTTSDEKKGSSVYGTTSKRALYMNAKLAVLICNLEHCFIKIFALFEEDRKGRLILCYI